MLLLWIYHMFSHVSGYISSCGCNLFQPVLLLLVLLSCLSCSATCFLCIYDMVTCCHVFSHVFVMAWTHFLLSHVLLSPVTGTWFRHVVYVFVRSWWLVQLSRILEAGLAMCLVTCLVKCSSYGDMLRHMFCHIGSGLSHVGDVLKHIVICLIRY